MIGVVPWPGALERMCVTLVEISSTLYEVGQRTSLRNDGRRFVMWVNGHAHVASNSLFHSMFVAGMHKVKSEGGRRLNRNIAVYVNSLIACRVVLHFKRVNVLAVLRSVECAMCICEYQNGFSV